jgi:hypothetical protein
MTMSASDGRLGVGFPASAARLAVETINFYRDGARRTIRPRREVTPGDAAVTNDARESEDFP